MRSDGGLVGFVGFRRRVNILMSIFGTEHSLNLGSFGAESFIHRSKITIVDKLGLLMDVTIVEIA